MVVKGGPWGQALWATKHGEIDQNLMGFCALANNMKMSQHCLYGCTFTLPADENQKRGGGHISPRLFESDFGQDCRCRLVQRSSHKRALCLKSLSGRFLF